MRLGVGVVELKRFFGDALRVVCRVTAQDRTPRARRGLCGLRIGGDRLFEGVASREPAVPRAAAQEPAAAAAAPEPAATEPRAEARRPASPNSRGFHERLSVRDHGRARRQSLVHRIRQARTGENRAHHDRGRRHGVRESEPPTTPRTGSPPGPDGNLWFTEHVRRQIGRITTAGIVTEFAVPTPSSNPQGITAGPDGNLWFTEAGANKIGRITTDGHDHRVPLPAPSSSPTGITAGPDGNLWFTESGAQQDRPDHDRRAPSPSSRSPPPAAARGITAGPDGNLWFTESSGDEIGRITPAGHDHRVPVPTARSGPTGITAGPDGNVWFTEATTTATTMSRDWPRHPRWNGHRGGRTHSRRRTLGHHDRAGRQPLVH